MRSLHGKRLGSASWGRIAATPVSMATDVNQTVKTSKEAEEHNGPSKNPQNRDGAEGV